MSSSWRGCVLIGYSWSLRRPSFSGPQLAVVFISCRSYLFRSASTIFHQLPPFETLEFTSIVMSRWGLTSRKRYRPASQYCVNCGLSVGQCQDLFFSRWSSLVLSRLDYGNSTFAGVSSYLLSRLQSMMNATARLIFSSSRFQHITPLLRHLHWLKAPERIAFKQSLLVFKCLHGSAPVYLTDEPCQVADVEARQRLRSSSSSSLSAAPDSLLSVTELPRLPLLVSGTVCQILSHPHLL